MPSFQLPIPEQGRVAYQQGEEAVMALFEGLVTVMRALEVHVQASEDQLAQNSSKPPSSDGPARPRPRRLRAPGGKPTGGQPGHLGHRLQAVARPDHIRVPPVKTCRCGQASPEPVPPSEHGRRQGFDVPPARRDSGRLSLQAALAWEPFIPPARSGQPAAVG